MTNEEIIQELKECYLIQSDDEGRRRNEAIAYAIESVERRTPKKYFTEYGDYLCPNCQHKIAYGVVEARYHKCCDKCGQRVFVEDENEEGGIKLNV